MNNQQQTEAVKQIVRIKNRILHLSDWNEIASLMQDAVEICKGVPASDSPDMMDKTRGKEWNIIAVQRLSNSIREKCYPDVEAAYPEITTSLLRLAMVFVSGGLAEINRILADSLIHKGFFEKSQSVHGKKRLSGRS